MQRRQFRSRAADHGVARQTEIAQQHPVAPDNPPCVIVDRDGLGQRIEDFGELAPQQIGIIAESGEHGRIAIVAHLRTAPPCGKF